MRLAQGANRIGASRCSENALHEKTDVAQGQAIGTEKLGFWPRRRRRGISSFSPRIARQPDRQNQGKTKTNLLPFASR